MPLRCSQSNAEASCRRSFRSEPGRSRLARRSASAACFCKGENLCLPSIVLVILIVSIHGLSSARGTAGSWRKSVHQRPGLRQILQCVGQIRTGSFVQTLNHTSDLRRHGKLHGAIPTLLGSPSSRSQFSGASWIGSHWFGMENSGISAECRHEAWYALCRAGNQRREASFEVADLPYCLVSLGSGRKSLRGFSQSRQHLCQLVQFISSGYSNNALAHAVASSV